MFTPGDLGSDKRLMRDLRRKVPESSPLKMWFISKDYEPTTFDQWVAMIQVFQQACKSGTRESARVASEAVPALDTDAAERHIELGLDVPLRYKDTDEEVVRLAVDVSKESGEGGVPFGPWDERFNVIEHAKECVRALGDAMNAARVKKPVGRMSLRGTVSKDILEKYPRCRVWR